MHKMRCCLSTEGVYCSRCVYYGKHQSFQATAGFRDYAPNAYSSSNRSEERFSRNAETDLVCRLLLEKTKVSPTTRSSRPFNRPSPPCTSILELAEEVRLPCASSCVFLEGYGYPPNLHSFPTRRSSDLVYYGKHQSFQATAGFRDYAPNAYSSSNGWSVFYQ